MNEEKMSAEEEYDSDDSDEYITDDSEERQRFAMKLESFFDELKGRIEQKVDELSQTVEEKVTIRMEGLLQEIEERISNTTSRIFEKAEEDSQIPLKKRKQFLVSIGGTDNFDIPSIDDHAERKQNQTKALNERVEILETSVNKLMQAVFPCAETSKQYPDSSKSPGTCTADTSVFSERVSSNPPKPTTFPRTSLVRGENCPHGTERRLKEENLPKQNVKGRNTFNPKPQVSPSCTVAKNTSASRIKDNKLRKVTSNDKKLKPFRDHFEQCTVSGEDSSDDIVEKELMSTVRTTTSSKFREKTKETQTGYTEMLDFHSAISGYSLASTSVHSANSCGVKPLPSSDPILLTSAPDMVCVPGSADTSDENSRGAPYADDTFPTMVDLSSEIVPPPQPSTRKKSPIPEPSICGLPLNSYIVVKVLSDGDTNSATEGLKKPIKEMILPIFNCPKSNTKVSTVSNQNQSPRREDLVCVPPPVATRTRPEINTNNKTEGRSDAASNIGNRSKFRVPKTIYSDYCRPSSTTDAMSSVAPGFLPSENLKSVVEKLIEEPSALRDAGTTNTAHRLCSAHVHTQQSDISLPVACKTPFEELEAQITRGIPTATLTSSSLSSLSPTPSQSPPPRVAASTIERQDDQWRAVSPSSHRLPSAAALPSPTSPPRGLESIIERRVDQSRALRHAAAEGRVAELRQLLAEGADPDARNAEGCTALHCAARRGMWLAMNALLDAGANAHAKDRVGWTALHCAAAYDPAALCVTALANAGADINERSNSKLTPLHLAAKYNNEKAARALLEAGACKTIVDAHGRTPIQVTHSDLVKNLLR